jgi:hypothetical protein
MYDLKSLLRELKADESSQKSDTMYPHVLQLKVGENGDYHDTKRRSVL